MLSPASRMLSAISFGVFWRLAPSTSAIIRSMKLSPGSAEICTTMRSESTRVPPVTAQRSPPDSRITGADSPVIADSSTEAMPSITSPSPGMNSPAVTTTRSPTCSSVDSRVDRRPVVEQQLGRCLRAGLAQRVGLGLAPALGHRLGEVGEQHGEPEPDRDETGEDGVGRRRAREVADEQVRS